MPTLTTDYTFTSSTLTATSAQVDGNGKPYTLCCFIHLLT